jgi:hypothetical protein
VKLTTRHLAPTFRMSAATALLPFSVPSWCSQAQLHLIHASCRILNFKLLACSTHFEVACTTMKVQRVCLEQRVISSGISLGNPYRTTGKSDTECLWTGTRC